MDEIREVSDAVLINGLLFDARQCFILFGCQHQGGVYSSPFKEVIVLKNYAHVTCFDRFISVDADAAGRRPLHARQYPE